jgi:hypothetical protein
MKFSELDSLKLDNARLEMALIKVEQQLNDARAELLEARETAQREKNKKLFETLKLADGKFNLKRNPDGTYETQDGKQ